MRACMYWWEICCSHLDLRRIVLICTKISAFACELRAEAEEEPEKNEWWLKEREKKKERNAFVGVKKICLCQSSVRIAVLNKFHCVLCTFWEINFMYAKSALQFFLSHTLCVLSFFMIHFFRCVFIFSSNRNHIKLHAAPLTLRHSSSLSTQHYWMGRAFVMVTAC